MGVFALAVLNWYQLDLQTTPSLANGVGTLVGECQLKETSSGLRYCDLRPGSGPPPVKGAFIKCHFTARIAGHNDTFANSYERNQPLVFKVGYQEVVAGWDEGILGGEDLPPMLEGGIRRLVLAPGGLQRMGTKSLVWMAGMLSALEDVDQLSATGAPTSDLVFDIELLPLRKAQRGQ